MLRAERKSGNYSCFSSIFWPHMEQGKPFFFVLNQSGKIESLREWDEVTKRPGPRQAVNLEAKIQSVSDIFNYLSSKIIQVSANEQYNLIKLIDEIVFALPKKTNYVCKPSRLTFCILTLNFLILHPLGIIKF